MNNPSKIIKGALRTVVCLMILVLLTPRVTAKQSMDSFIDTETVSRVIQALVGKHGEALRSRIEKGVFQTAAYWLEGDGSQEIFSEFCLNHFVADEGERRQMLARLEDNLESIYGNLHRINRSLANPFELAEKQTVPLDDLFARYNPSSHLDDMLYQAGVPFAVTLNFPFYNLKEKLEHGNGWTRQQWVEAAAGDLFTRRTPSRVEDIIEAVFYKFDNYQYNYNIHTGRLLDGDRGLIFKEGKKQISHWGLRDRLRAAYTEPDGGKKQKALFQVMMRVVDQTIPKKMINSTDCYWQLESNTLFKKTNGQFVEDDNSPEGGERYHQWVEVFRSQKSLDYHDPLSDSLIQRSFEFDRKIPEERVTSLILSILESPLKHDLGSQMKNRLKRPLEPFDIWYPGFKITKDLSHDTLDGEVKVRYPDARAFENDIPRILQFFGFSTEKSRFISSWIGVDDSKGMGHALAPLMRTDSARLRVRIPSGGMDYIAYNFAVHELGHNVEQVCSLHLIDHYLLRGVPNIAITEAFAFMFGSRNLDLLDKGAGSRFDEPNRVLDTFLFTYKTSGVALLDMKTWRWLYDHPQATAEELQGAVLAIAKSIWNQYFAEVFGARDVPILAVYTHLIGGMLYFPDYPLGQIISFQIEDFVHGKNLAVEMERMCRIGSVTPDLWMKLAVGAPISTKPLLEATAIAIRRLR